MVWLHHYGRFAGLGIVGVSRRLAVSGRKPTNVA